MKKVLRYAIALLIILPFIAHAMDNEEPFMILSVLNAMKDKIIRVNTVAARYGGLDHTYYDVDNTKDPLEIRAKCREASIYTTAGYAVIQSGLVNCHRQNCQHALHGLINTNYSTFTFWDKNKMPVVAWLTASHHMLPIKVAVNEEGIVQVTE